VALRPLQGSAIQGLEFAGAFGSRHGVTRYLRTLPFSGLFEGSLVHPSNRFRPSTPSASPHLLHLRQDSEGVARGGGFRSLKRLLFLHWLFGPPKRDRSHMEDAGDPIAAVRFYLAVAWRLPG